MDITGLAPLLALLLAAALGGGIFAGILFWLIRRGENSRGDIETREKLAEFGTRLAQIVESSHHVQSQISDRLQTQERVLNEALEKVSHRLHNTLEKSSTRTNSTVTELKERLATIDAAQKNITELSSHVLSLQDILSNNQSRGAFGEIQLQDLVSNILPPSTYSFQQVIGDNKRVDCLLRLPNPPGDIAIDAKFPLNAYRALGEAQDDAARTVAMRDFTLSLRNHIKDIARKYIVPGVTADAALMFLPSEAVYAELHSNFQNVVAESFKARVFIVSPTTLWATLNTVRALLKDARLRKQTGAIQHEIAAMMQDLSRLDDRVGNLQRHFDQAVKDIREIQVSRDKVTRRGEKIEALQLEDAESDDEGTPPLTLVHNGKTERG